MADFIIGFGSSLFLVGNRMVESSVSSPCALCLCGSSSYTVVITRGERRSTTETQSSQSTHRAPNQELENHRNLWLATGNSEEPQILIFAFHSFNWSRLPERIIATYCYVIDPKIYADPLISNKCFWIGLLYLNIEVASILSYLELSIHDFPCSVFLVIVC